MQVSGKVIISSYVCVFRNMHYLICCYVSFFCCADVPCNIFIAFNEAVVKTMLFRALGSTYNMVVSKERI